MCFKILRNNFVAEIIDSCTLWYFQCLSVYKNLIYTKRLINNLKKKLKRDPNKRLQINTE